MAPDEVTGIVLCGGRGRRLGGVDKPLMPVGDARLLDHVLARIRPQVSRVILSVTAKTDAYRAFNCELVADENAHQGPLGGLVSAFKALTTDWALTVPGDAPGTSPQLVRRLAEDASKQGAAVAHDGQRRQNLTMLLHRDKAASMTRYFEGGGRAVHRWLDMNAVIATDLSDLAASFVNVNTPADLEASESDLSRLPPRRPSPVSELRSSACPSASP